LQTMIGPEELLFFDFFGKFPLSRAHDMSA